MIRREYHANENHRTHSMVGKDDRIGPGFAQLAEPSLLIVCGVLITLANTILSYACLTFQVEIFPTRIRARAGGLARSSSRLAAMSSGFLIAFFLRDFGATGALGLVSACMVGVMVVIGAFGPSSRELEGNVGH
jgi:putative MFS transporter